MLDRPKILLLDDEADMLRLYRELLLTMPSQPEVFACDTGTKALAALESETFALMISDLDMPNMDGLQVLSIVRRKYPEMKLMVKTALMDDQFRARAYALGVDSFWQKPVSEQEIKLFLEGVESVLRWEEQDGFRGVQHKSLVDIVQLECLSQSSSVLKITNGPLEGRIWLQNGHVIDAAIGDLVGEEAFKKILNWKSGNFESLPAEAARVRTIFSDYQALLLDAAQTVDESKAAAAPEAAAHELPKGASARPGPLQESARVKGVDFILVAAKDPVAPVETWCVENPEPLAKWTREALKTCQELGEHFAIGSFKEVEGRGARRHVSLVEVGEKQLCLGLQRSLSTRECRVTVQTVLSKWVS